MKTRFACLLLFLAVVFFAGGTVRATPPGEAQPAGAAEPAGAGPAGAEPKNVQDQMGLTFNPNVPEPARPGFWKRLWFGVKTALGFGGPETIEAVHEAKKFVEKEIPYRQALRDYLKKGGDTDAALEKLLEEQKKRENR